MKTHALQKGYRLADKYIKKAEQYRDKRGYRENLGYDSYRDLKSDLGKLELSYLEETEILEYFEMRCHQL